MQQQAAETIAIQVLGWLAGNEEILPVFMGSTGASVEDLKSGMANPEFLGSVLDFVIMDDEWVVQCCDALGLDYNQPMQARQALPGGATVNWT